MTPRLTLIRRAIGAELYHGTSIPRAAAIVDSDVLNDVEDEEGAEFAGVSLTDNFKRAADYGVESTRQMIYDFENEYYAAKGVVDLTNIPQNGAVLVLNAQLLLRDFKVRWVIWQGGGAREERVIGSIKPLSRYLIGVKFDRSAIPKWIAAFEQAANQQEPAFADEEAREYLSLLKSFS